jgi:tRNA-guanine family transglycosylase
MRNEEFVDDTTLLNPACPLLTGVTRGYLRHLFHVDPPNAAVLATTQNLWFYQELMKEIRESVNTQ